MLAQGGGRIINVASMTSFFGSEQIPAYAASKGAVAQLTKALSNEWAGRGVNVNAIAPGYMVTQLTADMQGKNPAQYAEITGRIPWHRWGQPEDLQGAVVFLAARRRPMSPAPSCRWTAATWGSENSSKFPCNPANSCEKGMNPWGFVD